MYNWFRSLFGTRAMAYEDGVNSGIVAPRTMSGIGVDDEVALSLPAVYCAVTTISSMIAGLPLCLYRHLPDGNKDEAAEHPLYTLLRDRPCPELTKESYWQTVIAHVLLHGNHYSEIERDGSGRPVALWILPPEVVKPFRDPKVGLVYEVKIDPTDPKYLLPEFCFHIAGISPDGVTGYSPIRLCREAVAMTKACENFGASFFGNAARPSGVLQSPMALSDNARENLRKSWEALYAGNGNTGRTAILEDGVTWSSISIPAEDAQFLQTRQYQVNEIARLFNISPVFLHNGTPAWTDLETVNRQLVQITLMPWLEKIESQIGLKLLSDEERRTYFAEHDVSALLRADTKTRYDSYAVAIQSGWMLRSEARAAERLPPIDGLDEPVLQTKVETVDETEDQQAPQESDGKTSDQNADPVNG